MAWRGSGEDDPGSGPTPTATGQLRDWPRLHAGQDRSSALQREAAGAFQCSSPWGRPANHQSGYAARLLGCCPPGCFIDDAARVKCVDGKAHFTFWYPAGNPTALARRAVTSPRSAPASRGRQWAVSASAVAAWGPAKLHNGRPSSTHAVSSPRNPDWRACLAVQSGPWRLHCQGPSCG